MSFKNEIFFKSHIVDNLMSFGVACDKIECISKSGIPDLLYAGNKIFGWIEVKYLKQWPVREDTVVKFKHFTKEQRQWIYLRGQVTGCTFVLIGIGEDFLLFDHKKVFSIGSCTREDLTSLAKHYWHKTINYGELVSTICKIEDYQKHFLNF